MSTPSENAERCRHCGAEWVDRDSACFDGTDAHEWLRSGDRLRVASYGGGVQSTAMLVLAAQRIIDFPLFLFANVGDDSEHPASLRYVDVGPHRRWAGGAGVPRGPRRLRLPPRFFF